MLLVDIFYFPSILSELVLLGLSQSYSTCCFAVYIVSLNVVWLCETPVPKFQDPRGAQHANPALGKNM